MKKRLLSLLLTVCLVAALVTGLTGTANADDDKVVGYLTSYTLKAGDTIYGVCEAKKIDFNANLAMIGKINGITNYNYMMPGKVLWLPTKTATTSEAYYSLLSHTLVAGETPAALCQSYGIDYNANYKLLAALNNNLNVFMAGQKFILPLYVTLSKQSWKNIWKLLRMNLQQILLKMIRQILEIIQQKLQTDQTAMQLRIRLQELKMRAIQHRHQHL